MNPPTSSPVIKSSLLQIQDQHLKCKLETKQLNSGEWMEVARRNKDGPLPEGKPGRTDLSIDP